MRKFLPIAYLLTLLTGCATSNQVSSTARSSIEERLLISSFEQALAKLDTQEFKGKTVTVDFYGLTSDKDFAKEFFTAWLQGQQVQIATDPKQAQLHLKVFAPVLAVDQGQSFVGSPAFTVPISPLINCWYVHCNMSAVKCSNTVGKIRSIFRIVCNAGANWSICNRQYNSFFM